jgi:drug/metabolite transporter (DMT)-like permease
MDLTTTDLRRTNFNKENSMYFISMSLTVIANIAYHLCQKQIGEQSNPLVSLFMTYGVGMLLVVICFPVFYPSVNLIAEVRQLNWASYALGFGIVGLELGFLLAYRAGWNISLGALYSNVLVTVALIPIGLFFFHDRLSTRNWAGLILSLVGLVLMKR